jgi:hypothetical protein
MDLEFYLNKITEKSGGDAKDRCLNKLLRCKDKINGLITKRNYDLLKKQGLRLEV